MAEPSRHRELFVFARLKDQCHLVGQIMATGDDWPPARRSTSFRYARSWISSDIGFAIDPIHLPLRDGWTEAPEGKEIHGVFRDAAPDGWGQGLMAIEFENRPMGMVEFLAATREHRSGLLAFGPTTKRPAPLGPTGKLLDPINESISLDLLFEVARAVDAGEDRPPWLNRLLDRGSSLGGARPKAGLLDTDGVPWIAKFPMRDDKFDMGLVEAASLDMAAAAGIQTPEHDVVPINGANVLLLRRFDRVPVEGEIHRLAYMSAETALGVDPYVYRAGFSYADLSDVARRIGEVCAGEVFRRMIFNIMIGNNDDHLRNHAFLRGLDGTWRLSPVYDVVPSLGDRPMVMRVGSGFSPDISDALAHSGKFGISRSMADTIVGEVATVVGDWKTWMARRGVSTMDIERVAPAFGRSSAYGPVDESADGQT